MNDPLAQPSSAPHATDSSDGGFEAATVLVARFRHALDELLGLPDWQDRIEPCIESLGLAGQRQGIGLIQAALSLPLESKKDLVLALLGSQRRLSGRSVRLLSHLFGFATAERTALGDLKARLKLALNARYRDYKRAQSSLFERLRPVAAAAAKGVCFSPSRLEDCRQEAELGLLQAIDRAEPGKPLERYAAFWAKRRARNYLMKAGCAFSAPVNLLSKASLARADSDPKEIARALLRLQGGESLRADQRAFEETVEDPQPLPVLAAQNADAWSALRACLGELSAKQVEILALRFGLFNREAIDTLQEIANIVGISRQQVSRREDRALKKLAQLLCPLREELA